VFVHFHRAVDATGQQAGAADAALGAGAVGLGFYDDYAKIIQQTGGGTPPRGPSWWRNSRWQLLLPVYLWMTPSTTKLVSEVMVPFCKHPVATGRGPVWFAGGGAGDCRQLECGEFGRMASTVWRLAAR